MSSAAPTLRSQPQQKRGRATVERILQVSGELLEEGGVDAFNTNLLAARAGIGIRAIYRYFPNKWAILVAMAEQLRDAERAWVGDLTRVAELDDWRHAVDRSIDGYFAAASRHRGYVALRAASQAVPQLRSFDDTANRELEADLVAGLCALGLALDSARLSALSRVIIQSSFRILDIALQSEVGEAQLLIGELKHMVVSLLATYLK